MSKQLEKNYNPAFETEIYERWMEKGYFHAEADPEREPYTIVMPPPNITGNLHMGHGLVSTLQDILIRFKRMQGFNALWVPGQDHAAISTEVKIVAEMAREGLTKADLGREKFMERAWEWKAQYGGTIVRQLRKMGVSCDWRRERFTLDEGLSKAVLTVFVNLYEKGLIYRGEKLINWCPKCKTTISDAEVEHEDADGFFYHFMYPIDGTGEFIRFATTRPETMLGDTAIAVNPTDERYAALVGKTVTVPIVNRRIPIIADEYVEMDFGTGVVKITPAHDPNDFEVGLRHNLPIINIMNDDGTLNANAGPSYEGLDRYDARKKITEEFKTLGLYEKTEKIRHAVGTHERCHVVIEPLVKTQWFVKMKEMARPAIDAYKNGDLRIFPERFGKVYLNWLENIRDWCVSRQLWWGHRIPAYYCQDCGEVVVAMSAPEACPKCGHHEFRQDEDSLDTWFSSALWPFSTLGWPDKTPELDYFYPTNVLVTAYDILFFWVVRMVFSGLEHMGEIPFKDVLFHGLVRDEQGRKFSKSLGNGIDPLEAIDKYGADALRLTLVTGNALDSDTRFYWERMDVSRNFLNKLWNATRFLMMNFDEEVPDDERGELAKTDKWILSKMNAVVDEATRNMENYDLGMAAQRVYDFVWDEFCDWYIEIVKPRLYDKADPTRKAALWTLKRVLINALKLLHPYVPFITEEIFTTVQDAEETICLSAWPVDTEELDFPVEEREIETMKEAVRAIRNVRLEMGVAPSKKVKMFVVSDDAATRNLFGEAAKAFGFISGASEVVIQPNREGIGEDAVSVVFSGGTVFIPLAEILDAEKEMARLDKEIVKLTAEVNRCVAKLSNAGFMAKAPESLIDEENAKLTQYRDMLAKTVEQRKRFVR